MQQLIPDNLTYTDVGHLPIIKHFAKQINLVDTINELTDEPFKITYGHSKDHRGDLKQFLISMLCVNRNIPIVGAPKDGNASDKTLNNELLTNISKHMAKNGLKPGAFVYIADSAFVAKDNLEKADSGPTKFLSLLPATYKECSRAIDQAVDFDDWIELGSLVETTPPQKRLAAVYRAHETTVRLYDRDYRGIVIHSSAHDKQRHKRIDRLLAKKRKELDILCKKIRSATYYCRADAEDAQDKLQAAANGSYHKIDCNIEKVARFGRGRPVKDKPRTPVGYEYQLHLKITPDTPRWLSRFALRPVASCSYPILIRQKI